ncbi:hypothetical protein [Streptomyces sp. STR69]|uniref:hypothetical protein n=1 Tax=Streptomyces sp. STR69 TaxID=1796942 RepID=UPI0021C737BF|nr:hypothetical protein [Streptomyces sp. STR69]
MFASKKGSDWIRAFIVSGLEERPVYQARAKRFGGVRLISAVMAGPGLIVFVTAVVRLAQG